MNVELIHDADCPNVAATRSLLIKAFTQTGVSARWQECERSSPESPVYAQSFGSPTILMPAGLCGAVERPGTGILRLHALFAAAHAGLSGGSAWGLGITRKAHRALDRPHDRCRGSGNRIACPSCEVEILDMHQPDVAAKAKRYGIRSVPAVVVNGRLADCCAGRGPMKARSAQPGLEHRRRRGSLLIRSGDFRSLMLVPVVDIGQMRVGVSQR